MEMSELLANAGDPAVREQIYRRYYAQVQAIVHRRIQADLRNPGSPMLALFSTGDIVQETFVATLGQLDRVEAQSEAQFVAYLAGIVAHKLQNEIRRHEAHCRDVRRNVAGPPAETHGTDAPDSPLQAAADGETAAIYREVLATFGEREQQLLTLRMEEQAEFTQLATDLDYPSADAARKAYHAVRARLLVRLRMRGIQLGEDRE